MLSLIYFSYYLAPSGTPLLDLYDIHAGLCGLYSTSIARGGGRLSFQLLFIPQLGATRDPGHSTKIMRGVRDGPYFYIARRDPRDLTSISLFLSSKIKKPDAKRCHSTRDCKRCPSTSLY